MRSPVPMDCILVPLQCGQRERLSSVTATKVFHNSNGKRQ